MKWYYRCPSCSEWIYVKWENRDKSHTCPNCKHSHTSPSPWKDYEAYVDTHDWPKEMETAVISLRGAMCTVEGCKKKYETLDHRVPYSKGGKTNVKNLFPMCSKHNNSKGNIDYIVWLVSLKMKKHE